MSHHRWNLKHQTQEQIELVEDEANGSSHMLINPSNPISGDTLESIVHQATCPAQNFNSLQQHDPIPADVTNRSVLKKRGRSRSDLCGEILSGGNFQEDRRGACASASAAFCRVEDDDTTMVTWESHESARSMKAKTIAFASHNGSENRNEDRETKSETGRSHFTRRTRASTIHNLSERRRRDRINQKMDALQKLVPNASKTDKASILDEVIEYLKQLQAQVEMMSMRRSMAAQMMMMQQQRHQLQMSVLARMGIGLGVGMGIGMPDGINSLACNPSTVTMPPFVTPPPFAAVAQANPDASSNGSIPLPDPYCSFLAQSMNMELYNKMAALYRPQINQTTQTSSNSSKPNNVQED